MIINLGANHGITSGIIALVLIKKVMVMFQKHTASLAISFGKSLKMYFAISSFYSIITEYDAKNVFFLLALLTGLNLVQWSTLAEVNEMFVHVMVSTPVVLISWCFDCV